MHDSDDINGKAVQISHNQKPLATIWKVSDELRSKLKLILDEFDPSNAIGRKRIDPRAALDAIIFRLRSGYQWNQFPAEFPDDSSVHRTFQCWEHNGTLDQIWAALVEECEELGGVDWQWQKRGLEEMKRAPPTGKLAEAKTEPNAAF